ncbi:MAG: spermidine/putrescine import ATP-binding protein PotA [marine bacterium B5-7]|nr:MAG: spermidine/putrescine import ATP-binding protein PotA [marine bacterium B5-7]
MISIRNACKRFNTPEGSVVHALQSVSLEVGNTEFITLLGPSGCGKTTLLRSVSGFEDLDEGVIDIDGQEMTHVPPNKRPVNTVFQNYALFPHLSVGKNIGYGLEVTGCPPAERNQRVGEVMELVGLEGYERRMPRQLSGGQQQRVALARAIVNRPRVLLLDEPLSALDRKLRESMQLELKNIQHELGIAFVFVTHDQQEALTMSDRIVVIDQGAVQQIGSPTEVYDWPASIFVARFVGEGNLFEGELYMDGVTLHLRTDQGVEVQLSENDKSRRSGRAVVLIRPEDFQLDPTSEPIADHAVLEAEVTQTIFVGTDFQIVATIDGGLPIKATIRDPSRTLAREVQSGSRIRLRYRLDAPRVLPPDSSD